MKRELKKQIKEDEIVSGMELAWRWTLAHGDQLRVLGLAIVGVAVAVAGVYYFQGSRDRAASAAFDAAMHVYETPLATELAPGQAPAGVPPLPSAAERYRKAAAAFDGVERSYPTLPAGLRARYFGALCRIELGSFAEAKKTLSAIAANKEAGALEPGLARLALADIDRRIGAVDTAIEAYREMSEDASSALPRDFVLLSLATTLEDAKRLEEARASYQRLVERFPESVYAAEARRRAAYLGSDQRG